MDANAAQNLTPDQRRTLVDMCAMIETLSEVGGRAPASGIYMAFGSDINRFDQVILVANHLGFVDRSATEVWLTDKGVEATRKDPVT